jgi:AbrB family looped-hinge helix DNA binding protein
MTQLLKETTISAKGQIVIPAEMRAALHLVPGDKLILSQNGQAIMLERFDDVIDALEGKYANPNRSLAAELHEERQAEVQKK